MKITPPKESQTTESLEWDRGRLTVSSLGAMLGPVLFKLDDGREVSPLHSAPWLDRSTETKSRSWQSNMPTDAPPLLRELHGEWPCIPFGAASAEGLQNGWGVKDDIAPVYPHGLPANAHWDLKKISDTEVVARFDTRLIQGSTTQRSINSNFTGQLERRISVKQGIARVDLSLAITSTVDTSLPIGLHPVLRLPTTPGGAMLQVENYKEVWSYPGDTGGMRRVPAGVRTPTLNRLIDTAGDELDATALPFASNSEDLLLLTDCEGQVSLLDHKTQISTTLQWNAADLPHLLLWISNRGRLDAPWNGQHLALGIEPVCAAFDLGVACSRSANPLNSEGHATAVTLHAGVPWQTDYALSAELMARN